MKKLSLIKRIYVVLMFPLVLLVVAIGIVSIPVEYTIAGTGKTIEGSCKVSEWLTLNSLI